ncbi:MAG: DUF6089 family protein [Ginsengibacter sp.]
MKTTLKVTPAVLLVSCMATLNLPAQLKMSKFELGANLATFIYQGDLTPSKIGSFTTMKLGAGIYGNYKLDKIFFLKTSLMFGRLKGDESRYAIPSYRQKRNFAFTTPVTEISESVVWNILPPANEGGARLSPYIAAGVGYVFLHIKRDYSNYDLAYFGAESPITTGLIADTAHRLPRGLAVFPVSAGIRYALSNNLSLNLETAYRLNSSDYLDGFSQGANPAKKDHFFTNAIGLTYSVGKKSMLACPKLKY